LTIQRDYEEETIEGIIEHYENKIEEFEVVKELLDILKRTSNAEIEVTSNMKEIVVEVQSEKMYEEMKGLAMVKSDERVVEYNPEDETYSVTWTTEFW